MKKIKLIENLTDDQLLQIEKKLLKRRQLKIEDLCKESMIGRSNYDILYTIFRRNLNFDTIYARSGEFQCFHNRNRSQGDLYMLMRYYCPGISFKNFRKELIKLINNKKIQSFYCNDIKKRVFLKSRFGYSCGAWDLDTVDEFGYKFNKFNDEKERPLFHD